MTGIVGPNGCGKSNVVDAIRWVLGETSAKALRGGEMADVIFNGTEKRKPLGMAEVTLTLDECGEALKLDFEEVAITRRVFREGRGEYLINGTLCRLKDIHDLFADTGIGRTAYSIMAQGQIDQILSSKPEERRVVFEEAAGITKYKREKREAMRKLEYTEANLLRVSDVLAEQERRMNSLKRQVAKARRYQALAADVRVLDTHLGHKRFVELSAECGELNTSIARAGCATRRRCGQWCRRASRRWPRPATRRRPSRPNLSELRQALGEHRNALETAEGRIAFNDERQDGTRRRASSGTAATSHRPARNWRSRNSIFRRRSEALAEIKRRITDQEAPLGGAGGQLGRGAGRARARSSRVLREGRAEANKTQALIASTQARIESALAQLEGSRERSRQLSEEQERLAAPRSSMRATSATGSRRRWRALAEGITEAEGASLERAQRTFQRVRGDLDAARSGGLGGAQEAGPPQFAPRGGAPSVGSRRGV